MGIHARSTSLALPALLLAAILSAAPRCTAPGQLYILAEESSLIEGCFDGPCLCPVSLTPNLVGSFRLEELPILAPGPNRFFSVSDLRIRAGSGPVPRKIRGEGLYQNDPFNLTQQLDLELRFNDGTPLSFASGLVADVAGFPEIDIAVSQGLACFDTQLRIRALPLELVCSTTDGCAADDFCRTPAGQCGALGLCSPRGDACPAVADSVCGCDGATYGNECEARLAGVAVAAAGPCSGP